MALPSPKGHAVLPCINIQTLNHSLPLRARVSGEMDIIAILVALPVLFAMTMVPAPFTRLTRFEQAVFSCIEYFRSKHTLLSAQLMYPGYVWR